MNFRHVIRLVLGAGLSGLLCLACSSGPKEVVEPVLDGKTDVMSEVNYQGRLEYGGEARGEFVNDFQFDAWTFQAAAGARVTVDTTHAGTAADLDNTLFLYGPADSQGEFNGQRIAMDDDSGWGKHARLKNITLTEKGSYLVVLGTADGAGRGNYRLTLACLSQNCEPGVPPVEGCPGDVEFWFSMCMESGIYEDLLMRHVAMENCLERLVEYFDDECNYNSVPAGWCILGWEDFEAEVLPECVAVMDEEFPPDDLDSCDVDVLSALQDCVEEQVVEHGKTLEGARECCTDEGVFYNMAEYVCEYQSPNWCMYDFYSVWERMIADCRAELAGFDPIPEFPTADQIEQLTEEAVLSYLSYEDDGTDCPARDFVFGDYQTDYNVGNRPVAIQATSVAEGPINYCAAYTTWECYTDIRPSSGRWIEIETYCEDIGYDD